jgi:transcriptional regulator with XRE-family HTH domain
MKNLKEEIKERIADRQTSVIELEKRAKLKRSAISNILHERSKKPNYKTIEAVAKVLDCSALDLIGIDEQTYNQIIMRSPKKQSDAQTTWNPNLFNEAVIAFTKSCKQHNKSPINLSIATSLINEIYSLAIHKKSNDIDLEFVDFVIKRSI